MQTLNAKKPRETQDAPPLAGNSNVRSAGPQELRANIIEEIRKLFKSNISLALDIQEQAVVVRTEASRLMQDQREAVRFKDLRAYLNELQLNFYKATEGGDFQMSYMCLVKAQKLVNFLYKKNKALVGNKDWAIANLNEIVFLQSHGLFELSLPAYKIVLKTFKARSGESGKANTMIAGEKSFFGHFLPVFERRKLELRTLLSMSLMLSERSDHTTAVKKATKAFNTGLELLLITLVVCYHYLFKAIDKAAQTSDAKKESKKLSKIEFFSNLTSILKNLIRMMDATPVSTLKSSPYLNHVHLCDLEIERIIASAGESKEAENSNTSSNFYVQMSTKEFRTTSSASKPKPQNLKKLSNHRSSMIAEILKRYQDEPDLAILNNEKVISSSFLNETTILALSQLNYYSFTDIFVTEKLKNEVTESSILEKIAFVVISLYVLATEHRFMEHQRNMKSVFYKFLFDYVGNPSDRQSELFLGKAVEVAFTYLPDSFPFVSQIFNVFKKFELNRSKQIPESSEDEDEYRYLVPMKKGFRSGMIIPVIKVTGEPQSRLFISSQQSVLKEESLEAGEREHKRVASVNKQTLADFYKRRSASGQRIRSTDFGGQARTAILLKNSYLDRTKRPLSFTAKDLIFSSSSEGFNRLTTKVHKVPLRSRSKKQVIDENVDNTRKRKQSSEKGRLEVFRPKSAKPIDAPVDASPVLQKYLASKMIKASSGKKELGLKDSLKLGEQPNLTNLLQSNANRLNMNFNNISNLNFVVNSHGIGLWGRNSSPKHFGTVFKPSTTPSYSKQGFKKIVKDKPSLAEILSKFRSRTSTIVWGCN